MCVKCNRTSAPEGRAELCSGALPSSETFPALWHQRALSAGLELAASTSWNLKGNVKQTSRPCQLLFLVAICYPGAASQRTSRRHGQTQLPGDTGRPWAVNPLFAWHWHRLLHRHLQPQWDRGSLQLLPCTDRELKKFLRHLPHEGSYCQHHVLHKSLLPCCYHPRHRSNTFANKSMHHYRLQAVRPPQAPCSQQHGCWEPPKLWIWKKLFLWASSQPHLLLGSDTLWYVKDIPSGGMQGGIENVLKKFDSMLWEKFVELVIAKTCSTIFSKSSWTAIQLFWARCSLSSCLSYKKTDHF